MKLYYFPIAPNPTKVLVYLAEKGIGLEMVRVNLPEGEQRAPEHLARNPQGTLPVLELEDGSFLTESLPIIEYLEELHPEPVLIGSTPEERARVRNIERRVDTGVLMPGARAVHATDSPLGLPANPGVAKTALETAERALEQIDGILADASFLAGDRVTIADCTLWAALQFMEFFGIDATPGHANVLRWKRQFAERPSTKIPG
jgi:glutathione S-transferase